MKVTLNCSKPTLFKGKDVSKKEAPVATPANTQTPKQVPAQTAPLQQPKADTVEISGKKPEPKCEGPDCKKEAVAPKK